MDRESLFSAWGGRQFRGPTPVSHKDAKRVPIVVGHSHDSVPKLILGPRPPLHTELWPQSHF